MTIFKLRHVLDKSLVMIYLASLFIVIMSSLYFSGYGLDLTDEGFYLSWVSNPFIYSASVTQFGFIYHPLYILFDGDIVILRQFSIISIYFLSWILVNIFLKKVYKDINFSRKEYVILSTLLSVVSLLFIANWLITPNYNILNYKAVIFFAIGVLLFDEKELIKRLLSLLLLGVSGWLAFMAKPTTALTLFVLMVVYFFIIGKLTLRSLLLPLFTAFFLIFVTAISIDGSFLKFSERLISGYDALVMLNAGQTNFIEFGDFFFTKEGVFYFFLCLFIFSLLTYFSASKNNRVALFSSIISFVLFVGAIWLLGFKGDSYIWAWPFAITWSVPFIAVIVVFLFNAKLNIKFDKSSYGLFLLFILLPYAFFIGTNTNYYILSSKVMMFWVLASLILYSSFKSKRMVFSLLVSTSVFSQLVLIIFLYSGINSPYRQSSFISKDKVTLEFGVPKSSLILSKSLGSYLSSAINSMEKNGFIRGTPMIDLSGESPSLLYAIGAKAIGKAWMIGGYEGSNTLAAEMLKKVPCKDLSTAWVIDEPNGSRRLSSNSLLTYGADISTDFVLVAELNLVVDYGDSNKQRHQRVFRPVRSNVEAYDACINSRKKRNL